MSNTLTYRCNMDVATDWAAFEDGVVLFNPNNCNTVLYHPVLHRLKPLFLQGQFSLADCLDGVLHRDTALVLETLDSLEELGFVQRITN